MGEDRSEGPGPLALLLEAGREAVVLLRNSGLISGARWKAMIGSADRLDAAIGQVQPMANAEPKGRCCSDCGAALDDLPEIGAELLRMAQGDGVLTGAELEQRACHVAGFCSSSCWVRGAPESFPSSSL